MQSELLDEIFALITNYRDEHRVKGDSVKADAADEILHRIEEHESQRLSNLLEYLYANPGEY